MKRILAPLVLALASLTAQQPFQASNWLPDDYRNLVRVDLKALRDRGIWDELESSALKMMLGMLEQEAGFRLGALDRLTQVVVFPPDAEPQQEPARVIVLEGNEELDVPPRIAGNASYQTDTIGGVEVRRSARDWVFFRPRPDVQIEGDLAVLQPALAGKPYLGAPCADILSLRSTRKDPLLEFAVDLTAAQAKRQVLDTLFKGTEWPEGGAPQYLYGRMHATGDADDPRVHLEVVLRHLHEGEGIAATDKALEAMLAAAAANPKAALVRPFLTAIERSRDRGDLILKLDLGRAREAAGKLGTIMPFLMVTTAEEQIAPATPAPAAPPPAKKQQQ